MAIDPADFDRVEAMAEQAFADTSALIFVIAGLLGAVRDRGVLLQGDVPAIIDMALLRVEEAFHAPDGPGAHATARMRSRLEELLALSLSTPKGCQR